MTWRSERQGKGSGSRALVAGGDASAASTLEADRFSCQTLPCCICGFSGGQMEDYPCVGQQISRRDNARRLSPSDLRTTLPEVIPASDIKALPSHTPAKATTDRKEQLATVTHPA